MYFNLQILLLSSVLTSLTLYLYAINKNILNCNSNIKNFTKELILISVYSVFIGMLLMIKGITTNSFIDITMDNLPQILASTAILIIFVALTFKIIRLKKQHFNFNTEKVLALIGCTFIIIIMPYSALYIYYGISYIGFITMVCYLLWSLKKNRQSPKNPGVYYILSGSIALCLSTGIGYFIAPVFFNLFNLSLLTFIMFGFFLFYLNHTINEIENSIRAVHGQNSHIHVENIRSIENLVLFDDITGIQNRLAFEKELDHHDGTLYLGLLNILNFNGFNNLLGYERGNRIIKEIAQITLNFMPSKLKVYRYYADKFLILYDVSSESEMTYVTHNLYKHIAAHWGQDFPITFYIGLHKQETTLAYDMSSLIKSLEIASSIAKDNPKHIHLYTQNDIDAQSYTLSMSMLLKEAIQNKSFEMYYQPQVSSKTHEIQSFEALLRWKSGEHFISPSEFIPIAESEGLMNDLSKIVVENVFHDIANNSIFNHKNVAINLSIDQLIDSNFLDYIHLQMEQFEIQPQNIIFEITETSLFNDMEYVNRALKKLKSMGFKLSLDDFGNGYSSLFRFSKLDIDEVKFDKSFSDHLHDEKTFNTMKKTSELFHSFNMQIVVEGIETIDQLEKLRSMPIDLIQGYYFYKPISLKELSSIQNSKSIHQ